MANSVSHARLPYPIINARFTVGVPFLDADGDPTDPTTPDTEISQDGGAFADAAEEVTTITGSNGAGYITLTGAEMNNSLVVAAFKVASGPKATLMTLYPRNLPILESGTAGAGAAGTLTLASGTYTGLNLAGCFIRTTGGTGGGGTGGANNQARRITSYNTSTRVATVTPNWETTPDNTTTYDILLPEGVMVPMLTALAPTTLGRTLDVSSGGEAGLDWANIGGPTTTVNLSGTTVKTATDVETDTQDIQGRLPAALVGGRIDANVGAISGDATAADNLEAYTDGTTPMPVNATQISGDSTAADNLEAAADGSGYNLGGGQVVAASVTGAVGSVTGNVGGNVAGSVGSVTGNVGGNVSGSVGSVTGNVGGNVTGSVGSLAAQAKADVNAEVDSALDTAIPGTPTSNSINERVKTLDDAYTATRAGYLDNISAGAVALQSLLSTVDGKVDDIPTNSELATALAAADDAVLAAISGLNNLSQANIRTAIGLATANLDTQLAALPTAGENATAVWAETTRTLSALGFDLAAGDFASNWLTADGLATDAVQEIRNAITGYAGPLDTDANGAVRIVDGTGARELDTSSGRVIAGTVADKTGYSISGTIQTLDALDTAQDLQHAATLDAIGDLLTTAMPEDYAANGDEFNMVQGMYAIHQTLMQIVYAGESATVGKLDGTTAFVIAMNDDENPTSLSRAA